MWVQYDVRHCSRTRGLREVFGLSVVIVSPSGVPMHVEGVCSVFTFSRGNQCMYVSHEVVTRDNEIGLDEVLGLVLILIE